MGREFNSEKEGGKVLLFPLMAHLFKLPSETLLKHL